MTYPGGKNGSGVYQQIINLIPPHDTYIEPFLGSGTIMRLIRPARASIGIDIDADVIAELRQSQTPDLTLIATDGIKYLEETLFFPDTFIYCDPPYLFSTRSSSRAIYAHELDNAGHARLLLAIKALDCMVMVSGYPNAIYDDALSTWRTHTFMTTNRGGGHVTEKLWMNYPAPAALHDYRYLGSNFRERERLTRIKKRWTARLQAMPALERLMLAAAIAESNDGGQPRQVQRSAPACLATNCAYGTTSHHQEDRAAPSTPARCPPCAPAPTHRGGTLLYDFSIIIPDIPRDPIAEDGGTRSTKPAMEDPHTCPEI